MHSPGSHIALPHSLVSGNHRKQIKLFTIPSAASPAVLGSPWLVIHNPQIDWSSGTLTTWSVACHARCLRSALLPSPQNSTSPSPAVDLSGIPPFYHDLGELFSKSFALSRCPHRPYDCAIDLLPGAWLPSRLYHLLDLSTRPWRVTSVSRWHQALLLLLFHLWARGSCL